MMIATCIVQKAALDAPCRLDDRLDVFEVAQQSLSPENRDAVNRFRPPRLERFAARDVARLFELARMRTQIAVARIEQRFEFVEGKLIVYRQRAHNAEAHPLIDET